MGLGLLHGEIVQGKMDVGRGGRRWNRMFGGAWTSMTSFAAVSKFDGSAT